MNNLSDRLRRELFRGGAVKVGYGDLSDLPSSDRLGYPVGVSIAVKYPRDVVMGISELPTQEYRENYGRLNHLLDALAELGASVLRSEGHEATAQTISFVGGYEPNLSTRLPHKTVATRAGLGWIGKCALLVTEEFGSMVRISSILTNAPLDTARPVNDSFSKCGDCRICTEACPAGAVKGVNWSVGMQREDFFDANACRDTARERSLLGFGDESVTICGKCIEVCPYTQRYLCSQTPE